MNIEWKSIVAKLYYMCATERGQKLLNSVRVCMAGGFNRKRERERERDSERGELIYHHSFIQTTNLTFKGCKCHLAVTLVSLFLHLYTL